MYGAWDTCTIPSLTVNNSFGMGGGGSSGRGRSQEGRPQDPTKKGGLKGFESLFMQNIFIEV